MQHDARLGTMKRLLGACVCLCLVLQPILLRLHLALEDHGGGAHAVVASAATHDHHHGHAHAHPHPHAHSVAPSDGTGDGGDADGGAHPPHPAEDHLSQQQAQHRAPPSPDLPQLALPPAASCVACDAQPTARASDGGRRIPERPPPRGPTQPRAPPAIA